MSEAERCRGIVGSASPLTWFVPWFAPIAFRDRFGPWFPGKTQRL